MDKNIQFGVHNDEWNIDFYDDNSIDIFNYKTEKHLTTFDEEIVALFVAILKRDGHLDKLLEIDAERLRKLGVK